MRARAARRSFRLTPPHGVFARRTPPFAAGSPVVPCMPPNSREVAADSPPSSTANRGSERPVPGYVGAPA
jgi:hypothetical protein